MVQVHANLMSAPAVDRAFHQADAAAGLQDPIFRFRDPPAREIDRHFLALHRMPADRRVDGAARSFEGSRRRARGKSSSPRAPRIAARDADASRRFSRRRGSRSSLCRDDEQCRDAACRRSRRGWRNDAASAFTSVCVWLPAPGCTTRPAGLLTTSRSSSSKRISSGISSACASISSTGGTISLTTSPARTVSRVRADFPCKCTSPARINACNRERENCGSASAR